MVRYRCDRHRILKENGWMCILHQYHKASGLKLYTMMCRSGVNIKYISLIQDGGAQVHHVFFSLRSCCLQTLEGIWNNYVDIEQKVMQVIFIIFLNTWGYNSLGDPTRQHKVWKKILLQADPIERLTACFLAANTKQNSTIQHIRQNFTQKWPKWNYIAQRIWLWLSGRLD